MARVLKPAAVRAGLGAWVGKPARAESWVGFHTFRHTCATMLFRSGWNAVQVQKFLGLKRSRIYYLTHTGRIPFIRVGKTLLFDTHDLQQWIESMKVRNES